MSGKGAAPEGSAPFPSFLRSYRRPLFFEVLGPARDVRKKDVRPRRFIQANSLAERFFFSAGGAFRRSFVSRWCAHRAAGSGLPLGSADHAGTEAGPDFVFRQKRNAALLRDVFTIRGKRSNIRNPFVRHRIRIDATRSRTCTMRRLNLSDDLYGQSQVLGPASRHVPG